MANLIEKIQKCWELRDGSCWWVGDCCQVRACAICPERSRFGDVGSKLCFEHLRFFWFFEARLGWFDSLGIVGKLWETDDYGLEAATRESLWHILSHWNITYDVMIAIDVVWLRYPTSPIQSLWIHRLRRRKGSQWEPGFGLGAGPHLVHWSTGEACLQGDGPSGKGMGGVTVLAFQRDALISNRLIYGQYIIYIFKGCRPCRRPRKKKEVAKVLIFL